MGQTTCNRFKWTLFGVATLAGVALLVALIAVAQLVLFRSHATGGQTDGDIHVAPEAYLVSSVRTRGQILEWALDERNGRLFLTTEDGIHGYSHPALEHRITRATSDRLRLLGVLRDTVVVSANEDTDVRLLSVRSLEEVARIAGKVRVAATNQKESFFAFSSDQGSLTVATVKGEREVSTQVVPFPHARDIVSLAALSDRSLLYAAGPHGIYRLHPPYTKPLPVQGNSATVGWINVDEPHNCFTTNELGAFRIWRLSDMKPSIALLTTLKQTTDGEQFHIEEAPGDAALGPFSPGGECVCQAFMWYRPSRKLLFLADPSRKEGVLQVAALQPFSLLSTREIGGGTYSGWIVSADAAYLLNAQGNTIQCWSFFRE
jgi:hypothetical protein